MGAKNKKDSAGFTLIECLVALLIIAIVLASATRAILMTAEDLRVGYLRQAAIWVAENQIDQFRIDKVFPQPGHTQTTFNMAGVSLISDTTVTETVNPLFRRVAINVATTQNPTHNLIKIVSFVSQY